MDSTTQTSKSHDRIAKAIAAARRALSGVDVQRTLERTIAATTRIQRARSLAHNQENKRCQ